MVSLAAMTCILLSIALTSATPYTVPARCSVQCTSTTSSKSHLIKPMSVYTYAYDGQMRINLLNTTYAQHLRWTAKVKVFWLTSCDLAFVVQESQLINNQRNTTQPLLSRLPVVATYHDGQIKDICSTHEEQPSSLDITKAIISSFQTDIAFLQAPILQRTVIETDICGRCPTLYQGHYSEESLIVRKTKNHHKCRHKYEHNQLLPMLEKNLYGFKKESCSTCEQIISNGSYTTIGCEDINTVRVLWTSYTIQSNITSKLQLIKEEFIGETVASPHSAYQLSSLEHTPTIPSRPISPFQVIMRDITTFCSRMEIGPVNVGRIANLIASIRSLSSSQIRMLTNKIESNHICAAVGEFSNLIKRIILLADQETTHIESIEQLLSNTLGPFDQFWRALSLRFITNPSGKTLEKLQQLVTADDIPYHIKISAITAVKNYCEINADCRNNFELVPIFIHLDQQIGRCDSIIFEDGRIHLLTALQMIEVLGDVVHYLQFKSVSCFETNSVRSVQIASLRSLRHMTCSAKRTSKLLQITLNRRYADDLRIEAYLSFVRCADFASIHSLLTNLNLTLDANVQNFINSNLNNLQHDNSRRTHLRPELASLLETLPLYASAGRSRNVHLFLTNDHLQLRFDLDLNVLYSSTKTNLDVSISIEVLGHEISLAEFTIEDFREAKMLPAEGTTMDILEYFSKIGIPKADILVMIRNGFEMFQKLQEGKEFDFHKLSSVQKGFNWLTDKIAEIYPSMRDGLADTATVILNCFKSNKPRVFHFYKYFIIPTTHGIPFVLRLSSTTYWELKLIHGEDGSSDQFLPSLQQENTIQVGYDIRTFEGLEFKMDVNFSDVALVRTESPAKTQMKLSVNRVLEILKLHFAYTIHNPHQEDTVFDGISLGARELCFTILGVNACLDYRDSESTADLFITLKQEDVTGTDLALTLATNHDIVTWNLENVRADCTVIASLQLQLTEKPNLVSLVAYSARMTELPTEHKIKLLLQRQWSNKGLLWEFIMFAGRSKTTTLSDKILFATAGTKSRRQNNEYEIQLYTLNDLKNFVDLNYQFLITMDNTPPNMPSLISLSKLELRLASGDLQTHVYIRKHHGDPRRHQYHFLSKVTLKQDDLHNLSGDVAFRRIPHKLMIVTALLKAQFGKSKRYQSSFEYINKRTELKSLLEIIDLTNSKTMIFISVDSHSPSTPTFHHNLQVEAKLFSDELSNRLHGSIQEMGSHEYDFNVSIMRGDVALIVIHGPIVFERTSSILHHHSILNITLLSAQPASFDSYIHYNSVESSLKARIKTKNFIYVNGNFELLSTTSRKECNLQLDVNDQLEVILRANQSEHNLESQASLRLLPDTPSQAVYKAVGHVDFLHRSVGGNIYFMDQQNRSDLYAHLTYDSDTETKLYELRGSAGTPQHTYNLDIKVILQIYQADNIIFGFYVHLIDPHTRQADFHITFADKRGNDNRTIEYSLHKKLFNNHNTTFDGSLSVVNHHSVCNSAVHAVVMGKSSEHRPWKLEMATDFVVRSKSYDFTLETALQLPISSEVVSLTVTIGDIGKDEEKRKTLICPSMQLSLPDLRSSLNKMKLLVSFGSKDLTTNKTIYSIKLEHSQTLSTFHVQKYVDTIMRVVYQSPSNVSRILRIDSLEGSVEAQMTVDSFETTMIDWSSSDSFVVNSAVNHGFESNLLTHATQSVLSGQISLGLDGASYVNLPFTIKFTSFEDDSYKTSVTLSKGTSEVFGVLLEVTPGNIVKSIKLNCFNDGSPSPSVVIKGVIDNSGSEYRMAGRIETPTQGLQVAFSEESVQSSMCHGTESRATFHSNDGSTKEMYLVYCRPFFVGVMISDNTDGQKVFGGIGLRENTIGAQFKTITSMETSASEVVGSSSALISTSIELQSNDILSIALSVATDETAPYRENLVKSIQEAIETPQQILSDMVGCCLKEPSVFPLHNLQWSIWSFFQTVSSSIHNIFEEHVKESIKRHIQWFDRKIVILTTHTVDTYDKVLYWLHSVQQLLVYKDTFSVEKYFHMIEEFIQIDIASIREAWARAKRFTTEMLTWSRYLQGSDLWKKVHTYYEDTLQPYKPELDVLRAVLSSLWQMSEGYLRRLSSSISWPLSTSSLSDCMRKIFHFDWSEGSLAAAFKLPLAEEWPSLRAFLCSYKFKPYFCDPFQSKVVAR